MSATHVCSHMSSCSTGGDVFLRANISFQLVVRILSAQISLLNVVDLCTLAFFRSALSKLCMTVFVLVFLFVLMCVFETIYKFAKQTIIYVRPGLCCYRIYHFERVYCIALFKYNLFSFVGCFSTQA